MLRRTIKLGAGNWDLLLSVRTCLQGGPYWCCDIWAETQMTWGHLQRMRVQVLGGGSVHPHCWVGRPHPHSAAIVRPPLFCPSGTLKVKELFGDKLSIPRETWKQTPWCPVLTLQLQQWLATWPRTWDFRGNFGGKEPELVTEGVRESTHICRHSSPSAATRVLKQWCVTFSHCVHSICVYF